MSNKKPIAIHDPLENNYDQKTNKYEFVDENRLKQFFSAKNVRPKIVLVLDSDGGITPIKLSGYNTARISDINELNREFKAKISKSAGNKSAANPATPPAMLPIRYSDGISIIGMGENSCEFICCNGDIILVCD